MHTVNDGDGLNYLRQNRIKFEKNSKQKIDPFAFVISSHIDWNSDKFDRIEYRPSNTESVNLLK